ncbi:Ig-like domain repeat protein [Methanobrevibacter sp.]|uniref:Ig-like domain repeat protein n=1 Tax=Methanobrevibacter sp. TaxID=66852 RepID=UPI00388F78B9
MISKISKRHLLIFALLTFVLMMLPLSFANDTSDLNQTALSIDGNSQMLGDSQKDIYVSTTGDDDSGHGTQDSPYKSLEKAISESSATTNTIYMANGTYNEYGLTIGKNINIIGSGNTIIDAEGGGRFFRLTANVNFTLSDLTLQNVNESQYGGAIYIRESGISILDANLAVNRVKFINIYSGYAGAAIYNIGGATVGGRNNNVSITNCEFINCGSKSNGVILTQSSTLIANCTFIGSKSYSPTTTYTGSSIAIMGTSTASNVINITGCTFIGDSYTKGPGGVIYNSASMLDSININNNVFILDEGYGVFASSDNSALKINADNNWWGTNNPNLTGLANNKNVKISSYATLNLSADSQIIDIDEKDLIDVAFYNSQDNAKNTLIPLRNITLTSTGGEFDTNPTSFKGEVKTNFSSENIGQYTITAKVDNQELSTDIIVRDLTNKTVIIADSEVNYKDVTVDVSVAPKSVTGNVTFTINGKKETIELTDGNGNITLYNLPLGEYDNILLTYNGDASHKKSNTTISFIVFEKYPAELSAEAIVDKNSVTICAEINPLNATGNVTFILNGKEETIYLNEGKGNVTISDLANKNYTVELTYNGDENYQKARKTVNFTISNRNPTELSITPVVIGDNVTIYAKVNETSATGNVTFTLRYKTQVIELTKGEGNITVTGVPNDVYTLTFTYGGDADFEASNTTETFTVSVRKDTVLTAEATVKNQIVIIDVDINYYTAGGNVTFTINGENKIINITKSKGSITLEDVDYGKYSILLTYNGDINYNPSNYTLDFEVVRYDYGKILYVSNDGNDENNGSINSPLKTIAKAVDVANNFPVVEKIHIFDGIYNDSDMTVERSLDIEGESENTIIDAHKGFIFEIYGLENNVTFTNITFKNGYNENGGAIRDYGYILNITDCTFINNTGSDQGGAVYHYYGFANIINSKFIENKAISGGAVYVSTYTDLTVINNCEFTKNNALSGIYAGGAIYNAGNLYVNASTFTENRAVSKSNSTYDISGGDGGAIYNANQLFVNNSEFTSNSAYYWGGAIRAGGYSYIYDSNFTDNSAGSRGGAIHSSGSGSYSAWTTLISGCNFDSNFIGRSAYEGSTKTGGAICAESPTAIRYSNFTDNYAPDGGAIFMRSNAKYIDYCNFINNTANTGGAILSNRSMAIISNSNFEENSAVMGGAIYIHASNSISEDSFANLTSNRYVSNVADEGGAIFSNAGYSSPQELNIKYSEFIDNIADSGSAITTTNRANIEYNAIICDITSSDVINVAKECEGIVSVENNWWGINNPNLNNIIVGISAPESYAVLNVSASKNLISNNETSTILSKLLWNDDSNSNVELIPQRNITLNALNANLTDTCGVLDPEFESEFSSNINGTYRITVYVDNEELSVYVIVNRESALPKENLTLYADNVEITEGENATVVVYLTEYALGSVSINEITAQVSDGVAVLTIPDLTCGNYTFDVLYSGDLHYNGAETAVNITVNQKIKKNATIDVNDVVINEGERAKIVVNIDDDATGTISIKDKTQTISKGSATIFFDNLTMGNYTFDVIYSGDLNYYSAQSSVNITVKANQSKKDPSIKIDAPDITRGENATVTVTLPSDATGTVTVKGITADLEKGVAVVSVPDLAVGRNTLEVIYSGDEKYNKVKTTVTVKVKRNLTDVIYANASTGSDEFGNGSKENPVKTIYKAMTLAGDNGTVVLTGNFKGNQNTELYLSSYINNVTFIGMDGAVIDGEHRHFIISITDGQFTFVDLTFKNAYSSGYGAALINQAGYLTVEDCTFTDNIAQGSAAIDNTAILFVTNSTFTDNIASVYDGGAISSSWEAYITNSTFTGNRAYQNGGAIKNYEEGYLYIEDCIFKDNIATGSSKGSYGGAVYSWSSDLEIYMSEFENNLAESKGGAVYSSYGNSFYDWYTYIQMSEFKGNEAPTGSTLFLELVSGEVSYNAFLDDSNVVYTYRNLTTIDNNWWGVNDPDWSGLLTGTIKKPNSYAVLNVTASPDSISSGNISKLTYEFFWNGTDENENISLIPKRSIELSSTGGSLKDTLGNFSNAKFETSFTSDDSGVYNITANVDNEVLTIGITVKGGLVITPSAEVNGSDATIYVELTPCDVDANITFDLNNATYSIPVINGKGNITLTDLDNGNYTINLEFMGDERYPYSNATVEFTIDNKSPLNSTVNVSVEVDKNNVEISVEVTPDDATGNVTFNIAGKDYCMELINGKANASITDLDEGNYTFNVKYSGDDKYASSISDDVSFEVNKYAVLNAPDVIKYYSGPERFYVYLTDSDSNKLAGENLTITINGVPYVRTTNENGTASIPLNLNSGTYDVLVNYSGNEKYSPVSVNATVTIKATINATDLVKVFRNATQYYATFKDSQGNYLPDGSMVRFNIHGVFYDRYVRGNEGLAKLNINIEQGTYIITAINLKTGEMYSNNITVIPRIVENHDLTKYYRNASQYTVKLIGEDGNAVGAGVEVTFNINGVFYTRTTNASGIAKLNINLGPGDYIITASYAGCSVSNKISVLPVLSAEDITMKYHDGTKFSAKLLDGQGKSLANEMIEFNINGVFYNRSTDSEGIARLNINLMSGKYIITSSYNGLSIANTITII